MTPNIVRFLAVAIAAIGASGRATAHEFWLELSKWRPEIGDLVHVNLRVGEQFQGQPVVRDASRFRSFTLIDPEGEASDIVGLDGRDPAGVVRADEPGLHIAVYHGTQRFIEHEVEGFESYLMHDGLDSIIESRRRATAGQDGEVVRETYSRCCKALMIGGSGPHAGYDRAVGLPLEIIPVMDPFGNGVSAEADERPAPPVIQYSVRFHDKPIEGVLVVAVNDRSPNEKHASRTDERGHVHLPTTAGGRWLVSCVHMEDATGRVYRTESGEEAKADYESFWASLTFERAGAPSSATSEEGIEHPIDD